MAKKTTEMRANLNVECLEERATPAYLSTSGNLIILGSNVADTVVVKDVTLSGIAKIQVTQNGSSQYFNASSVWGQIKFWGYGGNDSFDYYGGKSVYANGGDGNDFLSADRGADLLVGGYGNDTLEGWAGNDELQGGDGYDTLDGGSGNDRLFGQAGGDLLGGGSGNDQLIGGSGSDVAFGGTGADQFWEVNTDPAGFFITGYYTRFGYVGMSAGVMDASASEGDILWS